MSKRGTVRNFFCLIMILTLLPATAFAEEETYEPALSGYEKIKEILSVNFDGVSSVSEVSSSNGTVTDGSNTAKRFQHATTRAASCFAIEQAPQDADNTAEMHGPALKLVTSAGTQPQEYIMGWYSFTNTGAVVYQGDFLFKDFAGSRRILEPVFLSANMVEKWGVGAPFIVEASGDNGVVRLPKATREIVKNKWYTFAAVVNMDEGLTTYFIDGEAVATENFRDKYIEGKTPQVNRARIRMAFKSGDTPSTEGMYIDNVKTISYAKPPVVTGITSSDDNTKVELSVSETLKGSTVTADNVKLFLNEQEVSLSKVAYEAKKIVITPAKPLHSSMEYKVLIAEEVQTAAGLTFALEEREKSFTTKSKDFDVLSVSYQAGAVCANLQNTTGEERTAIMAVLLKNQAGNIIGCQYSGETDIPAEGKNIEILVQNPNAAECEVFFLDGWANRLLIKNYVYTVLCNN